ncbi:TPA: DUF551 domain-containing protein [Salmonella enterica subsp. enterica serovar Orientalis]|nr:DUF551 domain-containing protein [Salmonella enterica]HEC7262050.1 DUF551 domain-containing protein [Salmonella enterica subsp. enterica serovar Orientalis]HCL5100491.1 DUF551 domain-containing protein [Salmonella enterica]HEC8356912.1 DUF551 domain-containing protein [Salmonella enterica subsp. enterica serovar Orientalis]HEC9486528.1 DUF551 domain-containing protein [Salmonella enterica subsp. enterica serovar Orientalis]
MKANTDGLTMNQLAERNAEHVATIAALESRCVALSAKLNMINDLMEAAERSIAEQSAIVAAAEKLVRCKGRYHSELNYRALAKLFGVITPDLPPLEHENVHYADAAEVEITALRQRIAELEAEPVSQTYKLNELSGNSQVTPDGWINCSERMPAQNDWVLIYSKYGEYLAGQVQGKYVELNDGTLSWLGAALHWMPLPEPPQEVK